MRPVILRRGLVALLAAAVSFGAVTQAQADTLRIGYQKYGTLMLLKAKGTLDKRLAERGLARVAQCFTLLNGRLAGRDFIAADRFSVADITAVVAVDFARVVKQKPGEQHPHLLRWRAAMAGRPSMAL